MFAAEPSEPQQCATKKKEIFWAAANGGVTNGGLRGVWPRFLEVGRNRPFSPFFALLQRVQRAPGKYTENGGKKHLLPQISSDWTDLLKPPSLKPPFTAPQSFVLPKQFGKGKKGRTPQKARNSLQKENQ